MYCKFSLGIILIDQLEYKDLQGVQKIKMNHFSFY